MFIKQLSVFVENRPGRLTLLTEQLAEAGVDIRALSVADTPDFGVVRMIVNDTEKAAAVLQKQDRIVSITPVIGVVIPDRPGGLAEVSRVLSDGGVNVEYMYVFITNTERRDACLVLRVGDNDNEKAVSVLQAKGVDLLSEKDISSL